MAARIKEISTFRYQKNGLNLTISLKIQRNSNPYGQSVSFNYLVHIKEPVEVKVEGTDPNDVMKRATAELDRLTSVTWERFLYVEVSAPTVANDGRGREGIVFRALKLSFTPVCVGTNSSGEKFHVFQAQNEAEVPDQHKVRWAERGLPDVGVEKGSPWDGGHDCGALLPDTPENRAKLNALIARLGSLAEQVLNALQPKNIERQLATMPALLGAPPAE